MNITQISLQCALALGLLTTGLASSAQTAASHPGKDQVATASKASAAVKTLRKPQHTARGNHGNPVRVSWVWWSDERLKQDIGLLERLPNGLGLYAYRYVWSDTVYVGVMAQEVAAVMPEAVATAANGYLQVDYQRLGMELVTLQQWVAAQRH